MLPIDVYRALLHLYPSAFRHEYGTEMALAFADELREARQARRWGKEVVLWVSNTADILFTAPQEHVHVIQQDLRYALRQFAASPGFTAVAIHSLALGIGANTAVFSLLNSVLLSALPVSDPASLVLLTDPDSSGVAVGSQGGERSLLSYQEFRLIQDSAESFSGVLASQSSLDTMKVSIDGGGPEEMRIRSASASYFGVLGVGAIRGRTWGGTEAVTPAEEPEAVISYEFWQRRFAGRDDVLGKTINIRRATFTVVGVMPPSFFGETVGQRPDAWLPLSAHALVSPGREWLLEKPEGVEKVMWLHVIGRLRPGADASAAEANVNVIFKQSLSNFYGSRVDAETAGKFADQRLKIRPAATGASKVRGTFAEPLLLLLAAAGIVLFIACANLGNILLSKAIARNRELSIRLALGASRGRLIRQLVTESLALAIIGGVTGIGAAILLRAGLMLMVPSDISLPLGVDPPLLGFAFALTIVAGLLMGLLPVFRVTSLRVLNGLHENSRGSAGSVASLRSGRFVVVGQVALSLPLLVGAGMLLLTLYNLQKVDLGFQKDRLLMASVDLSAAGYREAAVYPAIDAIQSRILQVPGVSGVAYSFNGVFLGSDSGDQIEVEGYQSSDGEPYGSRYDSVGPGYFSTLRIPLLRGREISDRDTPSGPRVCVINEAFAKEYFESRDPLGMHVTRIFGNDRTTYQVVGVVRDANTRSLRGEANPRFFLPVAQPVDPPQRMRFAIRATGDPHALVDPIQRSLREFHPDFAQALVRPVDLLIDGQVEQDRLLARLSIAFGAIALLLAMMGLYGVLSHEVSRRTREVGVRKALGARHVNILALILRETALLLVVGLTIGVAVAAGALRMISSRLYGLESTDPAMYLVAIAILVTIGFLASGMPARRAAMVDPIVALRHE